MKVIVKTKFLSWKEFEDHTLIIDSRTNKQVHRLNEVGALLWKSIEQDTTKDSLVETLLDTYDVSKQDADKDVEEFLKTLRSKALINE